MREDGHAVDDALYALAVGPDTRVRHYESCVVGDVCYNTLACDEGRKTQNSAVMSTDTYGDETTEMYANKIDIVQLQYITSFEVHRCVVLLCCHWYNLFSRIAKPRADDYFKSINVKAAYHTDEPFILADQATQVFFLEDTYACSDDWRVLQRFEQRNSFNEVAQQDDAYTAPDVEDSTDVHSTFEDHHVNDAGEKIVCRAVDIRELINKMPTFEDIEDEEEDDTRGVTIQTDTHGEDVDVA